MNRPEFVSTHPDIVWRTEALANHIKGKKYPDGALKPLPEGIRGIQGRLKPEVRK
jgi:hypothetical protein